MSKSLHTLYVDQYDTDTDSPAVFIKKNFEVIRLGSFGRFGTMTTFWKPGDPQPLPIQNLDAKIVSSTSSVKKNTTDEPKPKLSKGVLSMKFMKQKEGNDKIKKELRNNSLSNFERTTDSNLVCSTEHFDFVATLPGRRSFNGCNKAVERHYEQVLDDLNYKRKATLVKTDTISDEEMLKRYETLIGLPRGPNQGKKPDNRSISKQENGLGSKRGSNSKDVSNKKGKFR